MDTANEKFTFKFLEDNVGLILENKIHSNNDMRKMGEVEISNELRMNHVNQIRKELEIHIADSCNEINGSSKRIKLPETYNLVPEIVNRKLPTSQEQLKIYLVIAISSVAVVIGRNGCSLNEINAIGVAVMIQKYNDIPSGKQEREMTLTGNLENLFDAQSLIVKRLQMTHSSEHCDETELKCFIHAGDRGSLIGKNGEFIKQIHTKTGAFVKIAHEEESVPGAVDRLVYIKAPSEELAIKARDMIFARVRGRPFPGKDVRNSNTTAAIDTETVSIPCRSYRHLLEKREALIESTGASFQLATSFNNIVTGTETMAVVIQGEEVSRKKGCIAVEELISDWKRKEAEKLRYTDMEVALKIAVSRATLMGLLDLDTDLIRTIEDSTSVAIEVLQSQSSSSKSVDHVTVLLMGELSNIFQAQTLLLQEMQSYSLHESQSVSSLVDPPPAPPVPIDPTSNPYVTMFPMQPSRSMGSVYSRKPGVYSAMPSYY